MGWEGSRGHGQWFSGDRGQASSPPPCPASVHLPKSPRSPAAGGAGGSSEVRAWGLGWGWGQGKPHGGAWAADHRCFKPCRWQGGFLSLDTCCSLCLVPHPPSLSLGKLLVIYRASAPAHLFKEARVKSPSLGIIGPVRSWTTCSVFLNFICKMGTMMTCSLQDGCKGYMR